TTARAGESSGSSSAASASGSESLMREPLPPSGAGEPQVADEAVEGGLTLVALQAHDGRRVQRHDRGACRSLLEHAAPELADCLAAAEDGTHRGGAEEDEHLW